MTTANESETKVAETAAETKPKATKKAAARKAAPAKKASAKAGAKKPAATKTDVKPGLIYEREYKGKAYTLKFTERDDRVVFQLKGGGTFNSLTAAAKHVTEYPSISGVAFWGDPVAAPES